MDLEWTFFFWMSQHAWIVDDPTTTRDINKTQSRDFHLVLLHEISFHVWKPQNSCTKYQFTSSAHFWLVCDFSFFDIVCRAMNGKSLSSAPLTGKLRVWAGKKLSHHCHTDWSQPTLLSSAHDEVTKL